MAELEPVTATFPTVTRIYGLSRSELYRRLAGGEIRAVKNGKTVLIVVETVRQYLASLPPATYRAPANTTNQAGA